MSLLKGPQELIPTLRILSESWFIQSLNCEVTLPQGRRTVRRRLGTTAECVSCFLYHTLGVSPLDLMQTSAIS